MFPYPSGIGLHAGHASIFTINDVIARYQRLQWKTVFNPFGFDAFGLPTENYALTVWKSAREVTDENKKNFIEQLQALNLSFDRDRVIDTSMPDYYKRTQWLFQKLYKAGLVYRESKFVNWCPHDQTVLANDQVLEGCCERCKSEVVQKEMMQWFIKVTDYADRLIEDLDTIDWPEDTKIMQKNRIWRSEWAEITFEISEDWGQKISEDSDETAKTKIKRDELSYKIIGCAYDVHKELWSWLTEKIYHNAMIAALENAWLQVESEKSIPLFYQWKKVGYGRVDLLIEGYFAVELKSRKLIEWDYYKQLRTYMNQWWFESGLLLNFYNKSVEIVRLNQDSNNLQTSSPNLQTSITVYTTRPDTLYGVTALVLAPENTLLDSLLDDKNKQKVINYRNQVLTKTAIQRQQDESEKTGIFSGLYARHPLTWEEVPIWYADYVLMDYGSGAVMMVPAHDERDREFAQKFGIEVKQVISSSPSGRRSGWGSINHIYSSSWEHIQKLITYARELRKTQTSWEKILRSLLRDRQYKDMKRRRQHPLWEYIADFYNHEYKIVIEIDGPHHEDQQDYDKKRDHYMTDELWLSIIRIDSEQFFLEPGIVFEKIDEVLSQNSHTEENPHPNPLPEGEGALPEAYVNSWALINSWQFDWLDSEEAKTQIIDYLEEHWLGRRRINYKLRDWSVSRQRYRGCPIPIYYTFEDNEDGKYTADSPHPDKSKWIPHLIPEEELPVILPLDVEDFNPQWKSPLEDHPTFKYYEKDGEVYLRECDTLDTFMDSAFYFLRFPDAHNDKALISDELAKKVLPVDIYTWGREHTVWHLIYSRFIHKFLYDQWLVSTPEPFQKLIHQWMVLWADGRKMGKRYGNGVDPLDVIQQYGTDAVRTYLMFMGPIESDKPWNDNALSWVKKFLDKVEKIPDQSWFNQASDIVTAKLHEIIRDITADFQSYKFNTAVSKLMILNNTIWDEQALQQSELWIFAQLLAPFAPELAATLWKQSWHTDDIDFSTRPQYDESKLHNQAIEFPIQINGKLRWTLQVNPDITQDQLMELVQSDQKLSSHLTWETKKIIFIPGKIMNIINK